MRRALLSGALVAAMSATALSQDITFRSIIDKSPLSVVAKPGEVETEAVKQFKKSGQNPYNGNAEAVTAGKKVYEDMCSSCHLPDGSGRMGPSLIEDFHVHEEIKTDVGLFEIVYGGGLGAMQPFSKRLTQDEILRVMAYLRTLMKP
jgi:cytochrome c-L